MSHIYALEPRTRGAVELKTSHGPVRIALFANEAPKGVRSLIQHALDGYYDNLPFHRIIPNILLQVGDPTRTGDGGRAATESGSVPRESHGRLKFRRRGLVALVADDAGRCRSQFFITLAKTEWLDNIHTIVGSVEGDTVFNVLQMAECGEVDGFDVPNAPILHSIEVVDNPFDDIVATVAPVSSDATARTLKKAPAGKRAVKNGTLLSFGNAGLDDESTSDDEDGRRGLTETRVRKRPRTGGIVSRYDVGAKGRGSDLDGDQTSLTGIVKESARPQQESTLTRTQAADSAKGDRKREVSKSEDDHVDATAKVISAADEEFRLLQAQLAASDTKDDSSHEGKNEDEVQGGDGPGADVSLPGKYASLKRGVLRKARGSTRRVGGPDAEARMKELRARVAVASAGAKPLVFQSVVEDPVDDEYEVLDPLLGARGAGVQAPRFGNVSHSRGRGPPRTEELDIGRGRGLRRFG